MRVHVICGSSVRDSTCRFFCACLITLLGIPAFAQSGSCALDEDTLTCTGEFPNGIQVLIPPGSPAITTLTINNITSNIAVVNQPGVYMLNAIGGSIEINAGGPDDSFVVSTEGDNAYGIQALGVGSPSGYAPISALGIWVPTGPAGSGGAVTINNFAEVVTAGTGAHGIVAQNQVGTLAAPVVAALEAFDPGAVEYTVVSVLGDASNVGTAVQGSQGGTFTILGDGTYTFDAGTDFDNLVLQPGDELVTEAVFFVNAENDGNPNNNAFSEGIIRIVYFMDDINKDDPDLDPDYVLTSRAEIVYPQYGIGGMGGDSMTGSLLPDLERFISTLLADAGVAGSSAAVVVNNQGSITTTGDAASGVFAQTLSGAGRAGHNSCFFCSEPTAGGPGANGGGVAVNNDGRINTTGHSSTGIFVISRGGTGGQGGYGGTWWYGRSGGKGGRGGDVSVTGDGTIETTGDRAVGILAISEGGIGGRGGDADFATGGGHGGVGGDAGVVSIDVGMDITTEGDDAHAIWARSIGGGGGVGGSAGWLGTASSGSGGTASDGGIVNILSRGELVTLGDFAYGIFGQSIGGFGGAGGQAAGLFVAWGGHGASAGSAGTVTIVNAEGGSIHTEGEYAHGIFGQSIGGGGGSGGDSGGIVALGGAAGAGGDGGNVNIVNAGEIETLGDNARGVFVQSIGGGGGDGGHSGGLFAAGGRGGVASHGGHITLDNFGTVTTSGNYADAIFLQTIGGGGGSGGASGGLVSLGGAGGAGGNAGNIAVTNLGGIYTSGEFSRGIFAQSIGGGGGNGNASGGYFVSIGGGGGTAGHGGTVHIINSGEILTGSISAQGIFAQSIGGGGGNGGASGAFFVSIGGDGGAAGNGGNVTIENTGLIGTTGFASQSIFAQSIGGGGGNGAGSGAWAVSLGGDGAAAGDGGNVTIDNSGLLVTEADYSAAVFAQSIGGGGGNGAGTGAWFASIGGKGGAGGDGGSVAVINAGQIMTLGSWSHSVLAQSIGGGGGNGGGAGAGWVAIGGDGASGGDGGAVSVANAGDLLTFGIGAQGIHAESIGGGGGTGAGSGALVASLGGDGGSFADGGDLTVTNSGTITTLGDLAHSIYAVSIGGGGGSADTAGALLLSLGGDGGAGGDGGLVTVSNFNQLATFGDIAYGIFAQSVGGGGGNGGGAVSVSVVPNISFGVSIGGDGGAGGLGDLVTINNDGSIFTAGDNSHAIFAQSIGGSGGAGGNAFSFSASAPVIEQIPITINAAVSIGGDGAVGGDGGDVDINHAGDILTEGFRSYGIMAQSVGGGGGDGGNATSVTLNVNADISGTIAIGGDGDGGGDGGFVDIDSSGTIATRGAHSSAILAQSIGGGGGSGGDATTVSVDLNFPLSPEDLVPSPGMSFDVAIGGSGAGGGDGGDINVATDGTLVTEGDFAAGIMAQSIGGGGGNGGDARTIQIDLSANPTDFVPWLDLMSFESTLVFGGGGGTGGDGSLVSVLNNADIFTSGAFGYGIVAQSVGGGGGSGGNALTFAFDNTDLPLPEIPVLDHITGLTNLSMVLAGRGDSGGDGGDVSVINHNNIQTQGDFAHGIVAQSVAGGGGLAGIVNAQGATTSQMGDLAIGILSQIDGSGVGFFGSTGGTGSAGNVVVTNGGNISTSGDAAIGILAQSAAGQGNAGSILVASTGDIFATGLHSSALVAHSEGATGNGDIRLDILDGTVVGGTGTGVAIDIIGGASNLLTNHGIVASIDETAGTAIRGGDEDEFVENFGTVIGSVDLGLGANRFDNYGWLNSGALLFIGDGNSLLNTGTLSPGGALNVLTTTLTGDFIQTGTGMMIFDIMFDYGNDQADFVAVSGNAILDGTLAVNLIDPSRVMPGAWDIGLIAAAGGIEDLGIGLQVAPSAVMNFELVALDATRHGLRYVVDFAPDGMHHNYMSLGQHINAIQLAGGSEWMEPLAAIIAAQPDTTSLKAVYDRLSPHVYWANQAARVFSSMGFNESMHSCPVRDGDFRFSREGQCAWTIVADRNVDHAGNSGSLAASEHAVIFSVGLQRAIGEHWHGALAVGFERNDLTIAQSTERDGSDVSLGGILKGRYGPHDLSYSLSIGHGQFDTTRYVGLPTPDVVAYGSRDFDIWATHGRYAYNFGGDTWYLRPSVDLGYTHVDSGSLHETDGRGASLVLDEQEHGYTTARAALQFGVEWATGNGLLARPYARVGVTRILSDNSPVTTARLVAAPQGVEPFAQWSDLASEMTDAAGGIDLLWPNGITLRLGYEGQFADTWDSDTYWLKVLLGD